MLYGKLIEIGVKARYNGLRLKCVESEDVLPVPGGVLLSPVS